MSNAEKARELCKLYQTNRASLFQHLLAMAEWKDEQYKEREEGLREIINMLDIKLQKANESGMYYFDKCNVQKQQLIDKACDWLKNNARNYYSAYATEDRLIEDFKKTVEE